MDSLHHQYIYRQFYYENLKKKKLSIPFLRKSFSSDDDLRVKVVKE